MRRLMLTFSLCLFALCLRAQQADRLPLAKCAYLYFSSGQGDSLHSMLSDEMQAALPADALGATFNQLVAQFGPLQSAGEWHQVEAGGLTVCYRDLTFEKYALRFQAAFDGDGRIAGLFVKPAPKPVPAPAASPDSLAVVETDTAVVCGTFRLPATLTLPRRAVEEGRRVPCVVLVHGSGPHDRDEAIGPNRPFRDLAWGLAARGIATLRYDKRTYVYRASSVPEGRQLDLDVETVPGWLRTASTCWGIARADGWRRASLLGTPVWPVSSCWPLPPARWKTSCWSKSPIWRASLPRRRAVSKWPTCNAGWRM